MVDPDRWERLRTHLERLHEGQPDAEARVEEAFQRLRQLICDEEQRSRPDG